jgi:protein-S-isoprenylcysteine O-methyltransferase Ste14
MASATASSDRGRGALNKYGYNGIARQMFLPVMICAPLFIGAGTFDWPWAWVYAIACLLGWLVNSAILAIVNPELLNKRGQRTRQMTGTKQWDWIILAVYFVLLLVTPLIAGVDYRNGWTTTPPAAINLIGIALVALAFVPLTWSMAANRFFEGTVRIGQQDDHQAVEAGPYRYVRHPGYVGVILHFVAVPLAVGAWAALVPALIGSALFVVRTALEDSALRRDLPGYAEYAERTRYRLIPGIW